MKMKSFDPHLLQRKVGNLSVMQRSRDQDNGKLWQPELSTASISKINKQNAKILFFFQKKFCELCRIADVTNY